MNKRRHAFTLLELLTVIAILTLLIGILVPSLSGARRQAKANACLSNLKGLGTGFTIYLTENQDKFPPHRLTYAPPSNQTEDKKYVNQYNVEAPRWHWFLKLDGGPVIDPKPFERLGTPWDDSGSTRGGALESKAVIANKSFVCPALDDPQFERSTRNGAYGYNYQYLGNARQDANENRYDNFAVSSHQIPASAGTVLIGDSRGVGKKHGIHSYTLDPPRLATEKNARRFAQSPDEVSSLGLGPEYGFSPMEARHRNTGNVIFVDTHGEAMTHKQLGYQIDEEKNDLPVPIQAPGDDDEWDNSKWTGLGKDPKISERPGSPD